ncbi:hypothetical protein [Microbacterium sp. 13-71-7]|jgi:hypothetical protein|uniref:hypothetical protein n=1 Tax=Microbacterium sp. 13-71-7 TaxID=1970399 RepID=UPI000BD1213E|nr:hypothetical protein [Microbacterium sp. 13-71-7]OZB50945.1 MAG: hypothetical protein B7X40_00510 [Cellulomonas sp. 14-74-6]OZB84738.1 MAG: hypothetical protein B7X32_06260 [Microbacterium sp. 13-71-7]
MITIAPAAAPGSWRLAEALLRCESARERIEATVAVLRAIDADCGWRSRSVEFVQRELEAQRRALAAAQESLPSIESALRVG